MRETIGKSACNMH